VCLAVPTRALPAAMAQVADRLGPRTTLVVLSKGLVPPAGELPTAFCAARAGGRPVACLGGPGHAADALEHGAALVIACGDREQTARLRAVFADAGFDVETTSDVEGVDLAGVAKNAAVLAAATASVLGPNAAGAAAGKIFSEVAAYAGAIGGQNGTWVGLAGAGDLVASVVAANGRNRRAGELLARGVRASEVGEAIGQVAESIDTLPLLATALEQRGVRAPATRALADVVEGNGSALAFAEQITAPRRIVGTRVA
jgi:glycerol-3-phosphate dehydrogenase